MEQQQEKQSNFTAQAAEHAINPRNYGRLSRYDGRARITGPCGDTMEFWLQIKDEQVKSCTFITDGCGPSLASGSVATELARGRTLTEAAAIGQQDILSVLGGLPQEVEHCALLAADTLRAACRDILQRSREAAAEFTPAAGREAQPAPPAAGNSGCEGCTDAQCQSGDRRQGESQKECAERQKLLGRLRRIDHKIFVLSGKGGVGKSTVAVNLAFSLMLAGKRVGLLDVDIHGPSVPTLLDLEGEQLMTEGDALLPVNLGDLKVMSIGFLLRRREEAVIWRGPMKMGVIRQFLADVEWGDLDYLIVDTPPGTGDEPLSVCQLIENADGALLVATPQEVALSSVRKSVTFCRQLSLPVLGVVENMSGFVCPHCGRTTEIFLSGGAERMAREMSVPFLGRIPIDPGIAAGGDAGKPFVHADAGSATSRAFAEVVSAFTAGGAEPSL
jgi:ATP-binding protein involved in chromosome partitioning